MKIAAGQSLAREVDLAQHFQLTEPGNFSVSALIRMPGDNTQGTSTNRMFFNQSPGRLYWSQKVGIPGKSNQTREFRILNFAGDSKSQIYAQIVDGRTGQFVRTFLLGDVLMLRKPLATVDRQQRMHVMFLTTPTMWVHCVIDTDGRLEDRQIHQRGPQGDPQLLTFADGTVRVANSIPYDPKAAAEQRAKIRKASDRPLHPLLTPPARKKSASRKISLYNILKISTFPNSFSFPTNPMKTILPIFLVWRSGCVIGATASAASFRTVVIDPGHGGQDNGVASGVRCMRSIWRWTRRPAWKTT